MEVAYLKVNKNPLPFLKYFKSRKYTLREIHPENLVHGISALPDSAVFIPFEVSENKNLWIEISQSVDARGIRRLFPKSTFIEMCLKENTSKELIERKARLSEDGFYHFLFYKDNKGLKTIGSGLSPHRKLTQRSPLHIISKRDEAGALTLLEKVLSELDFGFLYARIESNRKEVINVELDPLPDLSAPTRECVLIAQSFGFSYQMLLSIIERNLRF